MGQVRRKRRPPAIVETLRRSTRNAFFNGRELAL